MGVCGCVCVCVCMGVPVYPLKVVVKANIMSSFNH